MLAFREILRTYLMDDLYLVLSFQQGIEIFP